MPFLEEKEWVQVAPLLGAALQEIKDYREQHDCDLHTARLNVKPAAMAVFELLTGMGGVHYEIIHHHRLSDWGSECGDCGYLLRSPKANSCVNCGSNKSV